MLAETVLKAVLLKRLIDNAPNILPNIGRCPSLEKYFKEEHFGYQDAAERSDEDDEENEADDADDDDRDYGGDDGDSENAEHSFEITAIRKRLRKLYDIKCHDKSYEGFENFEITVLGEKLKLEDICQEHVEKWTVAATSSPFGNVALQETQHNDTVRSSRELDTTQFEVGEDFLEAIAKQWEENLIPKRFQSSLISC